LALGAVGAAAMASASAAVPDIEQRVDGILKQMSVEEKIGMVGGAARRRRARIPRHERAAAGHFDGPCGATGSVVV